MCPLLSPRRILYVYHSTAPSTCDFSRTWSAHPAGIEPVLYLWFSFDKACFPPSGYENLWVNLFTLQCTIWSWHLAVLSDKCDLLHLYQLLSSDEALLQAWWKVLRLMERHGYYVVDSMSEHDTSTTKCSCYYYYRKLMLETKASIPGVLSVPIFFVRSTAPPAESKEKSAWQCKHNL